MIKLILLFFSLLTIGEISYSQESAFIRIILKNDRKFIALGERQGEQIIYKEAFENAAVYDMIKNEKQLSKLGSDIPYDKYLALIDQYVKSDKISVAKAHEMKFYANQQRAYETDWDAIRKQINEKTLNNDS